MGEYMSKQWQELKSASGLDGTPLKRPNHMRFLPEDPRSPTSGISRTPIAIKSACGTPSRAISCYDLNSPIDDANSSARSGDIGGGGDRLAGDSTPGAARLRRTNSVPDSLHRKAIMRRHYQLLKNDIESIGSPLEESPRAPAVAMGPGGDVARPNLLRQRLALDGDAAEVTSTAPSVD